MPQKMTKPPQNFFPSYFKKDAKTSVSATFPKVPSFPMPASNDHKIANNQFTQ